MYLDNQPPEPYASVTEQAQKKYINDLTKPIGTNSHCCPKETITAEITKGKAKENSKQTIDTPPDKERIKENVAEELCNATDIPVNIPTHHINIKTILQ